MTVTVDKIQQFFLGHCLDYQTFELEHGCESPSFNANNIIALDLAVLQHDFLYLNNRWKAACQVFFVDLKTQISSTV